MQRPTVIPVTGAGPAYELTGTTTDASGEQRWTFNVPVGSTFRADGDDVVLIGAGELSPTRERARAGRTAWRTGASGQRPAV